MTKARGEIAARYLLRFDDLCPGMDRRKWERFASLVRHFEVRPILAVVPDNRDAALEVEVSIERGPSSEMEERDAAFWREMREFQGLGATIGLHGFRHLCVARGRSLVGLNRWSEFAGVAEERQRAWMHAGIEILRARGLEPQIWVAPRHGFDRVTLRVLQSEGIQLVSDGFAERPFQWLGVTWLPQQLWGPVEKKAGLWTICLHPATATEDDVERLEGFLENHQKQFTSVREVLDGEPFAERSIRDRAFHGAVLSRMGGKVLVRRLEGFGRRRWR